MRTAVPIHAAGMPIPVSRCFLSHFSYDSERSKAPKFTGTPAGPEQQPAFLFPKRIFETIDLVWRLVSGFVRRNIRPDRCGMEYESNPKHSEPWQRGQKGSLCPKDIKAFVADLLAKSEQVGKQRFVVHEGKAYCGREHREGVWHGFPVGWMEVPAELRNRWRREGLVKKRDLDRYWEGHE